MKLGNVLSGWALGGACSVCIMIVMVVLSSAAFGQVGDTSLTLKQAITRALDQHPDLKVFPLRQQGLEGRRQAADLSPAWRVEAEVEGVAGTGDMQGVSHSEQTLALSSVIELGNKRAARVAVVDARSGHVDSQRQIDALQLISEVTQGFIDVLAAQQRLDLAEEADDLAKATLQLVQRRADAGAAPAADVLKAKAAKTQAMLAVTKVQRQIQTQRLKLATLLGTTTVDFGSLSGNLLQFSPVDRFSQLYQRAKRNPVMQAFNAENRLKEAELELAQSHSSSDIEWRLGVRRMETTGDMGVIAGVSLPLFSGQRQQGELLEARAERHQVQLRRRDALLELHATLYDVYSKRQQAIDTVDALQKQVIPTLTKALQMTQRAYQNGRYRYTDWVAAQRELLDAKRMLIDAAAAALSFGAVIEQLTAEPLSAVDASSTDAPG